MTENTQGNQNPQNTQGYQNPQNTQDNQNPQNTQDNQNPVQIHFAPLQGYADHVYRRLHNEIYGGIDTYYTPFIRVEKGEPRRQDMARLKSSKEDSTHLIPQIIFNSMEEFDLLTSAVKDAGYSEIDLNLGCPFPMQTKKGRGAALLLNPELMAEVSQRINEDRDTSYSIKARIGLEEPDQWKTIMPILNQTPLQHITIHPRIAKQQYTGEMYTEEFAQIANESTNPVIFNGDILSVEDIRQRLEEYPQIKGLMIGRGLLSRPSLAAEWHSGQEWSQAKRMSHLRQFHHQLLEEYESTLCGEAQILQKIKPFWEYLEEEIGHKGAKLIRKATSLNKYKSVVEKLW